MTTPFSWQRDGKNPVKYAFCASPTHVYVPHIEHEQIFAIFARDGTISKTIQPAGSAGLQVYIFVMGKKLSYFEKVNGDYIKNCRGGRESQAASFCPSFTSFSLHLAHTQPS